MVKEKRGKFSKFIDVRRKELGLKHYDIAHRMGLSPTTWYQYQAATRPAINLRVKQVMRLAGLLGVPTSVLVSMIEEDYFMEVNEHESS